MIFTYLLLPIGFVLLIKGADFLVDGASSIAKKLGISALAIGLTIVAFGTSVPELIVNIFASIQGNTDIAIGNILGSNIANILLILGISAAIYPLAVKKGTVWKEIPFALLAVVVVALMVNDAFIDGGIFSGLTRIDGFVLIAFFVIFLYYTFGISRVEAVDAFEVPIHQYSLPRACLMILFGLVGLTVGGKWIVDAAVALATALGVSEALIGLTIVAIGTSLPELATSAVAAYKKDVDIAVGNIVGSNIFNIFWILGVSAIINPLPFSSLLMRDMLMTIFATVLLFAFLFIGKRHILERWQGVCLIALYVVYIAYLIFRG
jgi:cation:H+ antiporter